MGAWAEGRWVWEWRWRRRRDLFDSEKVLLDQLINLVNRFNVQEGVEDGWRWKSKGGGGSFKVKEAYDALALEAGTDRGNSHDGPVPVEVWSRLVPAKAASMAWRLMHDRLPTKDNLLKRKVPLATNDTLCPLCKEVTETSRHIFLECKETYDIWLDNFRWIETYTPMQNHIRDHFLGFTGLLEGRRGHRRAGGIWICIVWTIWKGRNKFIFENISWDTRRINEEIKGRVWSWLICYDNKITRSKLC